MDIQTQNQTHSIRLDSPSLDSNLIGELDNGVALFRGIPYADVKTRWTQSIVRHSLDPDWDATKFSYRSIQPAASILVSGGVADPVPGDDEFKCLNLNVCVMEKHLPTSQPRARLPVLVWIHGGSFISGSNSVARYAPQRLCAKADQIGLPVVIVAINYRLGVFGFTCSNDLVDDNRESGEDAGNYGFMDQKNAFEWVQAHIQDFGGDPGNVTAFGVSAGAACINFHMLSGKPLFDRAILMSGTAGTLGPLPFDLFETQWKSLVEKRQLSEGDPRERLQILRDLQPNDLIAAFGKKPLSVWADGEHLSSSWQLGQKIPTSRCKGLLVGDVRMEGIILDRISQVLPQENFWTVAEIYLPKIEERQQLSSIFFGVPERKEVPAETYRDGLRMFFSVVIFHYPSLRIAETTDTTTYLYHFEQPSPFPGPTFGHAFHGQCATFMYMNQMGTEGFTESACDVGLEMAKCWIMFANGKEPWRVYRPEQGDNQYMRFGPGGKSGLQDITSDTVRPQSYLPWVSRNWQGLEALCRHLLYKL